MASELAAILQRVSHEESGDPAPHGRGYRPIKRHVFLKKCPVSQFRVSVGSWWIESSELERVWVRL